MRIVLLLGRPDAPTDGVADYAEHLAAALRARGADVELRRVPWAEEGWPAARAALRRDAASWRGATVVVQYTALLWSRRGLPWLVPSLLRALGRAGTRIVTVFHDPEPYPLRHGVGALRAVADRLRRGVQRRVMRESARLSALSVVTVPPEALDWLPPDAPALLLPVGPNIPERPTGSDPPSDSPRVAVFAFTGKPALAVEVADVAAALRAAAATVSGVSLVTCGRNADLAGPLLRHALSGSGVHLDAHGLLPPQDVTRLLGGAAAALFVRGQITSGRGSAVAAIACGLPIVGYAGAHTAPPLTDAGVLLVPNGDRAALAAALARLIGDSTLSAEMRRRSVAAYRTHFAWDAIAGRLLAALDRG